MNVITILDVNDDTEILIDGVCIHEGSGIHTRRALRALAESFGNYLEVDVEWETNNDEDYEEEEELF